MKTPERLSALRKARQTLRNRDRRLARVTKKLEVLTSECGVEVEKEVQEEIQGVIDNHGSEMESLPGSDFRRIFWDQQVIVFNSEIFITCTFIHVCLIVHISRVCIEGEE